MPDIKDDEIKRTAVMEIIDELMDAIKVLAPRLYNATIDKLNELT